MLLLLVFLLLLCSPTSVNIQQTCHLAANKVEAGHVLWRKTVFAEGFLSRRPRELIPAGRKQSRRLPHSPAKSA
jgi:hypothetical protein